jgi:C-terminal domain 9 of the ABC-three component (ABC-3C) systems
VGEASWTRVVPARGATSWDATREAELSNDSNRAVVPGSRSIGVSIDQSGSTAGADIVARDKIEIHYHPESAPPGIVDKLISKLQSEIKENIHVQHTIDALANYQKRRSFDGIDGLEAKLTAANRQQEVWDALDKKEQFAKLLQKWSLYASAQEIFAYLLAKAEFEFNHFIHPKIQSLSAIEVDQMVHDRIVQSTINECGVDVFVLNHGTAMGMLYWLAEQCFVRWHK